MTEKRRYAYGSTTALYTSCSEAGNNKRIKRNVIPDLVPLNLRTMILAAHSNGNRHSTAPKDRPFMPLRLVYYTRTFTFLVYLLNSSIVHQWNVMYLHSNNTLSHMTLNDVKTKSDSLQTDWMSATSLTLFSCLQKNCA